jgi:hypothetical protein
MNTLRPIGRGSTLAKPDPGQSATSTPTICISNRYHQPDEVSIFTYDW